MSYSFNVRAPSKASAKEHIAAELAKVRGVTQSEHNIDSAIIQKTADSIIDLLVSDDAKDVAATVHGSIGLGTHPIHGMHVASVGLHIEVSLAERRVVSAEEPVKSLAKSKTDVAAKPFITDSLPNTLVNPKSSSEDTFTEGSKNKVDL